jgi:glycosyltransferase involved in cell wall biosynthesis
MTPRVSVIVPVYNGAVYLHEALRSLALEGEQAIDPEVLVVDDGSTDDTPEVARRWAHRIVYRRQDNAGPAAARNAGLAIARGDVIGFLDADDLWPPGKLATQLRYLDAHPDVDAVLGTVQWLRRAVDGHTFEPFGAPTRSFQLGCGLFRRRIFHRVGTFDPAFHPSDDVDWLLRAREMQAAIAALEEVGLLYRHHEASLTYGASSSALGLLRVIKESIVRRRGEPGANRDLPPVRRT